MIGINLQFEEKISIRLMQVPDLHYLLYRGNFEGFDQETITSVSAVEHVRIRQVSLYSITS